LANCLFENIHFDKNLEHTEHCCSELSIVSPEPQADTLLRRKRISGLSIVSPEPQADTLLRRKRISGLSIVSPEPPCLGEILDPSPQMSIPS
jgi:hypothetical protein